MSVAHDSAPMVLVVEDLDESRELVHDILVGAGFRVLGARNGIDAVDSAVKLLPDIILMDLSLPLMGGCEAARLLKSDVRTRDIPIIALTGHTNFIEMARAAGCDAVLTKPCDPERLISQIERTLEEATDADSDADSDSDEAQDAPPRRLARARPASN